MTGQQQGTGAETGPKPSTCGKSSDPETENLKPCEQHVSGSRRETGTNVNTGAEDSECPRAEGKFHVVTQIGEDANA